MTEKRNWKEIVDKSNGTSMFLPEKFLETAKAWQERRVAFEKKVADLAAEESSIANVFQNLIFSIRTHYAENGRPEIWTSDVGFNSEALKDGEYIFDIVQTPGEKRSR